MVTAGVERDPDKQVLWYLTQGEYAVFRLEVSPDMKEVIFRDRSYRNSFKLTKDYMEDLAKELQQLIGKMED